MMELGQTKTLMGSMEAMVLHTRTTIERTQTALSFVKKGKVWLVAG